MVCLSCDGLPSGPFRAPCCEMVHPDKLKKPNSGPQLSECQHGVKEEQEILECPVIS